MNFSHASMAPGRCSTGHGTKSALAMVEPGGPIQTLLGMRRYSPGTLSCPLTPLIRMRWASRMSLNDNGICASWRVAGGGIQSSSVIDNFVRVNTLDRIVNGMVLIRLKGENLGQRRLRALNTVGVDSLLCRKRRYEDVCVWYVLKHRAISSHCGVRTTDSRHQPGPIQVPGRELAKVVPR